MFTVHRDTRDFYETYENNKCTDSVIVYGVGEHGCLQIGELNKIGVKVECAFDANPALQGTIIDKKVCVQGLSIQNIAIVAPAIHAERSYRIVMGIYDETIREEAIASLKQLYLQSGSTYSCDVYTKLPLNLYFRPILQKCQEKIEKYAIESADDTPTKVSDYWSESLVCKQYFYTPEESLAQLQWRFDIYPLFRMYYGGDIPHTGEVFLDYGCGPGNDTAWFSINNNLKQMIAMDVSYPALIYTQYRMALHDIDPNKVRLIKISDKTPNIPLQTDSVDYINCQGVLMHTSNPQAILDEFNRVLRPDGSACIMVYNKNSVFFHLYAAYYLRFIGKDKSYHTIQNVEECFSRAMDGFTCPLARCYEPEDFLTMCKQTFPGRCCTYVGGYPSSLDLSMYSQYLQQALEDPRLEETHKQFLRDVKLDTHGYPLFGEKHAGVSGVYWISKANQVPPITKRIADFKKLEGTR